MSPRTSRPFLTSEVIAGLRVLRSIATVELLDAEDKRNLERAIEYIDAVMEWFDAKDPDAGLHRMYTKRERNS